MGWRLEEKIALELVQNENTFCRVSVRLARLDYL